MGDAQHTLLAQGLTKRVRDGGKESIILDGVDFELSPKEVVALVGPSGAGKSSLLHILGALDPNYEGSVAVDGQDFESLNDAQRAALRNRTIGFVFQAFNLLPHLTVLDNVVLPSHFGSAPADRDRARQVLEEVGMQEHQHRTPGSLSGGERQRVAIARALYQRPKVVLCDEPTGNLDEATGGDVVELFSRLAQEGAALVVATHDKAVAKVADRILQLEHGKLQA